MAMWHFCLFFLLFSLPRGNALHGLFHCAAFFIAARCTGSVRKQERMSYRRWYAHPPCYKSTQW